MKKDIDIPEVKNVTIAIVREDGEWKVYLINNNNVALQNTLVSSTGYGEKDGAQQKTSTLRHFLETIPAKSWAAIEQINEDVFHLSNEYWVSYYIDKQIFDKKFVFVPDSIKEENLIYIKELEREGVLHS
jgi:transposase